MIEFEEYRVIVDIPPQRGHGVIDVHPPPPQEVTDRLYAHLSSHVKAAKDIPTGCVMKPKEIFPVEQGRGIRFLIASTTVPHAALKWLGQQTVGVLETQTGTYPDISFGSGLEAASQDYTPHMEDVNINPDYL